MYTEDSEDYSQGFSLDALEKTYLKRLQEKEDDELDLEIDVLTPPKICRVYRKRRKRKR